MLRSYSSFILLYFSAHYCYFLVYFLVQNQLLLWIKLGLGLNLQWSLCSLMLQLCLGLMVPGWTSTQYWVTVVLKEDSNKCWILSNLYLRRNMSRISSLIKNSLGTGLKEQVCMNPLILTVTHWLTGTATSTKFPELFRGFDILFDSQVSFSTWASGKG